MYDADIAKNHDRVSPLAQMQNPWKTIKDRNIYKRDGEI